MCIRTVLPEPILLKGKDPASARVLSTSRRVELPELENTKRTCRIENDGRPACGLLESFTGRQPVGKALAAGVGEAEADSIFEPGVRGSAGQNGALNGGVEGAGLGLPLARRLARAARGDVEAHPDHEGGRFTIVLPTV